MPKRIDLSKFRKRADAVSALVVVSHVALVLGPIYIAAYMGPRPSWILLCLWFGILMNGLLNLMHECAHYHTFRERSASDFLGRWILGPLAGANFDAYRARHWQHHLHLGSDEDTKDAYLIDVHREKLLWFLLRCLFLGEAIRKFRHQTADTPMKEARNSSTWMLRAVFLHALLFASLAAVAGDVRGRSWGVAFEIAALAYAAIYAYGLASVTVFMSTLRAIAEHQVESGMAGDHGRAALRNFARGPLSWLIFGAYGFSEHGTHHCEPGLPYYWLPEATRELALANTELAPMRRYTQELLIMFRSVSLAAMMPEASAAPREP